MYVRKLQTLVFLLTNVKKSFLSTKRMVIAMVAISNMYK
jgi:hypothetical protein